MPLTRKGKWEWSESGIGGRSHKRSEGEKEEALWNWGQGNVEGGQHTHTHKVGERVGGSHQKHGNHRSERESPIKKCPKHRSEWGSPIKKCPKDGKSQE